MYSARFLILLTSCSATACSGGGGGPTGGSGDGATGDSSNKGGETNPDCTAVSNSGLGRPNGN